VSSKSVPHTSGFEIYETLYERSLKDPADFWEKAAKNIHWFEKWTKVLDDSNKPFYRWFTGGVLNTCYNCLDVHIANGRGSNIALIYDSPVAGIIRKYTFGELLLEVKKFAQVLRELHVAKGDRVVIYMPMVPEAVVAMLACARIGAVHSVVFGGFASDQLAARIHHARPKVVVSASYGIEPTHVVSYKPLLDHAIEMCEHKPEKCVIFQRTLPKRELEPIHLVPGRDLDYATLMNSVTVERPITGGIPDSSDCEKVLATDPLYILYTSGTTGTPKGVVRDNGGHAVALKWALQCIYNRKPGDVYWAASDIGWVVGHSFIVYGPLLNGTATVLYEGKPIGTPNAGSYWRVIEKHSVQTLFAAPTAIRAIKREDPTGELIQKYDLQSLESLFLAGERADPDTVLWLQRVSKKPVFDHWWQTETGWPVTANSLFYGPFPVKPGSSARPVPGWDVQIFDQDGNRLPPNQLGEIVLKLPLPPGALPSLYNNDDGFIKTYLSTFPGYYRTGDVGMIDDDGYVHILSRVDDVIKVAGHRLAAGMIEEALASHPSVAECAVIAVPDEIKGEVPVGFIVLKAGTTKRPADVAKECVERVREHVGPVAAFKKCIVCEQLPKTRSGKILRTTMRQIANRENYKIPPTIDNVAALDHVKKQMKNAGLI
jgi:propionyl-CoA synthetase